VVSESIYFVPGVKGVFSINIEEVECVEDPFLLVSNARLLVRLVCVLCGKSRIRRLAMPASMMTILGLREDLL
jgi:hypothetical protein